MKYAWDLPNSSLHQVKPDGSLGREVGHCERVGDRHQERGWRAIANKKSIIYTGTGRWFPDESMAMQAVLDRVEGRR